MMASLDRPIADRPHEIWLTASSKTFQEQIPQGLRISLMTARCNRCVTLEDEP